MSVSARFIIITGGEVCLWSPSFTTRREAALWLSQDHDFEERTEVQFEGDTVHTLCEDCGEDCYADRIVKVDEDETFETWLCDTCQTPDFECAYVMCQVCAEPAWSKLVIGTAPIWTCEDCAQN